MWERSGSTSKGVVKSRGGCNVGLLGAQVPTEKKNCLKENLK